MKRRLIIPTLVMLMTPLTMGSSPLLASGDDAHEDETESTDVPQSSVPRRERNRSSVPPSTNPIIPTTSQTPSATTDSSAPPTTEVRRRRVTTTLALGEIVVAPDTETDDDSSESNDDEQPTSSSSLPVENSVPNNEPDTETELTDDESEGDRRAGNNSRGSGAANNQQSSRMLGMITEALRLLDGKTSDASLAAVAALQSVQVTLEMGELPSRDIFEAAMRLVKDALTDVPTARASLTLAGVIAAVETSKVPDEVKARLLIVLQAAQDQVAADPTSDARQIVRDALKQVRDARVASAIGRLVTIVGRLEASANEQGNAEALALLVQVRTLIQPVDGAAVTRDQLHQARDLVREVVKMLAPKIPTTSTTVPDSSVPDSSVPDSSVPDSSVPA